ncbi:glycosyltransferase 87 family protein [Gordonia sp. LSe1-13]|uniref:Glycosyltransferase 87 family protein n=1 Tax=Gordonia sesuvii TaxID=3116777 RepID=A0ABU7MHB8_9ACTN|nr:glycosyltransferase 87 family protein [Gordonia sp. LSe1-13]
MSVLPETDLSGVETRLRRWVPSTRARVVIAATFAVSVILQIVGVPFTSSFGTRTRIDLDVYRLGAQIWQQGQSLYADGSMPFTSDGIWLPFTYPPFAAIGFVPLGLLGLGIAGLLMSVLTAALVVVIVHIVLGVSSVGAPANRWWIALLVGSVALWSNPLWMTLGFGQINIILMTLIVVDLFVVGRGRARAAGPARGVLTGLAGAVKLTPMVFVTVFLTARQWRSALTAVGTFLGAGLLAWIWLPADSLTYWTHTLFHTTRIGDPAGRINQNLNAMWIRLVPHEETTEQLLWVASSLVVTALAFAAVRACRPVSAFAALRDPQENASAGVVAVLVACVAAVWGLLVSPTSWAHHWVWAVPTILAATVIAVRAADRRLRFAYGGVALAGVVVFALGPFQFLSAAVRQWSVVDHIVGNAYTLWGLGLLLVVVLLPPQWTGDDSTQARPALADVTAK